MLVGWFDSVVLLKVAVNPLALDHCLVGLGQHSATMALASVPLSFILLPFVVREDAVSLLSVVDEGAHVAITVVPFERTLPVALPIEPIAGVLVAVVMEQDPVSLLLPIDKLALVTVPVPVVKDAIAVLLVVDV